MAKDRKAGYYWIQKDDKWMIAEWIYGYWYITGSELEYSDTEIYDVGDYIGRGGDKVYSENANCAIFDVSFSLPSDVEAGDFYDKVRKNFDNIETELKIKDVFGRGFWACFGWLRSMELGNES